MASHSLLCLAMAMAVITASAVISYQADTATDEGIGVIHAYGCDVVIGDIRPYMPCTPSTGLALPSESTIDRYPEIEVHTPMTGTLLPPSIDLSEDPCFPVVGDQGGQGSCSAWSITYYAYGYLEAKDHDWDDASTGNPEHLLSPAWTYNMVSRGLDQGCWMWDVALVLKDWGGATMASMPYDDTDITSWGGPGAFRESPEHRVDEVVRMDYDGSSVDQLKALLVTGIPVTFTFDSSQFNNFDGDFVLSSTEYQSSLMDHSQTLVGYDDSIADDGDIGAFRVVNSWGDSWGDSGYYWITYETMMEIGESELLNLCYVTDKVDYQPQWLIHWSFSDPVSRDALITFSSGGDCKSPYFNDGASTLSFPDHMWCDLTEIVGSDDIVQLSLGASTGAGSLASMDVEWYGSGFQPGMADVISSSNSELPIITPATVTASIPRDAQSLTDAAGLEIGLLTTVGDSGWCIGTDGNETWPGVRSGTVAEGDLSTLTMQLAGPTTLGFDWMVEATSSDILSLSVDGMTELMLTGTIPWTPVSIDIGPGQHTVSWTISKEGPQVFGSIGCVANIEFYSSALLVKGDVQLEQLRQDWSLSGTGDNGDPIVIAGMVFDAEASSDAVNLINLSMGIRFENCAMMGAENGGAGIKFVNCSQVTLYGCTLSGNDVSIDDDGDSLEAFDCVLKNNKAGPGVHLPDIPINTSEMAYMVESLSQTYDAWAAVDGGPWQNVMGTIPLMGDGHHTIALFVEDACGNEYLDEAEVLLDTELPFVEVIGACDGQHLSTSEVALTVETEDIGAGMASVQYSLDGASWTECGGQLLLDMVEGEHIIDIRAIDGAGNVNVTRMILVIDLTDPELNAQAWVIKGTLFMSIDARDVLGGVDVSMTIDQGGWAGPADQVDICDLDEGDHTVAVRVVDEAGNTMTMVLPFFLDLTAPSLVSWIPNGTDASTVDAVSVIFDETIDETTASIIVMSGGEAVMGVMTVNTSLGDRISFQPDGGWALGTEYDVTVTVEDLQGNAFTTQWSFATSQEPFPWGVLAMLGLAVTVLILFARRRSNG